MAELDEAMFKRWLHDVDSEPTQAEDVRRLEMEARLRRLALSYEAVGDRGERTAVEGASDAEGSMSTVE